MSVYRREANPRLLNRLKIDIAQELHRLMPNYQWGVTASDDGSTLQIRAPKMGQHAYVMHTLDAQQVTGRRERLRRAVDTILTAYHVDGTKYATSDRPSDPRGGLIPEL